MVRETTGWITFRYKGKELCRISVEGISPKEIQATKGLLAHNCNINIRNISVKLVKEIPLM